ncbi:MAG: YbgC/FadM family acyl-CoA thioesterase, partial [Pseudomonadota bacterium]
MKRQDFRFFHRLRVRWAEVDMQKIVFNAHYLMYFDTAISDYWRALALPYEEAMHQLGGDLYVKKASLEYHGSARFDDQIDVALRCARVGNSSMLFTGAVFRGDELLISCDVIYVFADPATQSSRAVPDVLRAVLTGFEAKEPVTVVKQGSWNELGTAAASLRKEVFVQEQNIPAAIESDASDQNALHFVVFNRLGQAVASARLLQHGPAVAKVGRMAVKRVLRGSQLGSELLHSLLQEAKKRGDTEIVLDAQASA